MDLSPASLTQKIVSFQSQVLDTLFGGSSGGAGDTFSALLAQQTAAASPSTDAASLFDTAGAKGLAATGRNASLFDPESAYNMMSLINNRDVLYKAQFSELSHMSAGVAQEQAAAHQLGSIASPDEIQARLAQFAEQYNQWRKDFGGDVQKGGLLAGTQAAEVSLYELDQSIKNRFFGAADGVRGLADLGFSIDPTSHLATLDTQKLQATLSANPQGAVNALHEFAQNFAKSAELLNSANNFIPNQLDNLNRAIHYISDNKVALTQEFGTGDPAKPTGQVARALAAYNQTYA